MLEDFSTRSRLAGLTGTATSLATGRTDEALADLTGALALGFDFAAVLRGFAAAVGLAFFLGVGAFFFVMYNQWVRSLRQSAPLRGRITAGLCQTATEFG